MTSSNPDLFEMRRLESLSNTIFGVAMTLLAYDLPKTGTFASLPDWADLYRLYAGKLSALMLSFIIAGLFWFSHHRRLARQPEAGGCTGATKAAEKHHARLARRRSDPDPDWDHDPVVF